MKKSLIVFLLVILACFAVLTSAAGIQARAESEDRTVQAGGEAVFTITIKNTQAREDNFKLDVNDFAVSPFSEVVERVVFEPSSEVKIGANQEAQVIARITFTQTVTTEKNYITEVNIESTSKPDISTSVGLSTFIISPRDVLDIELDISEDIIPGQEESLSIKITNNANIHFDELDVFYTSSVFNFEDTINLGAFEEKEIKLNFNLDPLTAAEEYTLTVRVFDQGDIKGSKNFKFNVGLNPDLKEVEECRRQFLRNVCEIVKENEGNKVANEIVKVPVGYFQRFFTDTDPQGTLVNVDGDRIFQWVFDVPPGDIYRIEVITDYRTPFFVIVGVLILVGAFLYLSRKDLKITKTIFKVHEAKAKEDVTELKILLNIKNRTHKEKYHVKVIDLLPRTIKPDTDFGTLHPSKIEEGSMGMRMVWELDKFDPGDEIVITYKVKTKLPIIGKLELPAAVVQYYGRKKRVVNVKSNKLIYGL